MRQFFSIKLQDTLTVLFFPLYNNYLKSDFVKENSNQFFNRYFRGFSIFSFKPRAFLSFLDRTDTQIGCNNNDYFDGNIKLLEEMCRQGLSTTTLLALSTAS